MEKTVDATFDGEVFRPDEPVDLEPNTKVRLQLEVKKKKKPGKPYAFLDYLMSLNMDGPSDWSTNLDDYLYGGKSLDNDK
jgi:Uncharacterized protein conserved in archaea